MSVLRRALVVALTLWALLVVMPDILRLTQPLGTLGFSADNDGRVYDVDESGPAAAKGVQAGDRIALDTMSCRVSLTECTQLMSVFGGMGGVQFVRPDSSATLWFRSADQRATDPPRRHVTIDSRPEEHGRNLTERTLWKLTLAADELAALAFILGAAALYWRRPCTMTAGFFGYALWFNPGQYFEFYSWLQPYPVVMLAQETLQAIFQSLGYVGFLVLALYFPNNVPRPRFAPIKHLLPWIFVILAALQLASFLNVFGVGTESITRVAYIAGWSVDLAVLVYVLPAVLTDQPPEERARTRWLLTGCVVGLCSFIFADFNEATTMSPITVPDSLINLLYFFNVITLAVVIYSVRHHRVVNVSFVVGRGLERLGLWALVTALGALIIHRIDEGLGKEFHLDNVAISLAIIGVTLAWERIQEFAMELLDFVFFPRFRRRLAEVHNLARRLWQAKSITHLEHSLTERTTHELRISSAAVFRYQRSGGFRRRSATGWPEHALAEIDQHSALVSRHLKDSDHAVRLRDEPWTTGPLPDGVGLPTVAVPIRAFGRLHAIVLYGAHFRGDDLNSEEVDALDRLARSAEIAYQSIEAETLRRQVRALRRPR